MFYFPLSLPLLVVLRTRIASLEEELKGFWKVQKDQSHFFSSPLCPQWEAPSRLLQPLGWSWGCSHGCISHGRRCWGLSHIFELGILPLGRKMCNGLLKSPRLACLFIWKAHAINSNLDEQPNSRCSLLTFWRINKDGPMMLGLLWSSSLILQGEVMLLFVKLCLQWTPCVFLKTPSLNFKILLSYDKVLLKHQEHFNNFQC